MSYERITLRLARAIGLILLWLICPVVAFSQETGSPSPAPQNSNPVKAADRPMQYWIDQLGHERYLRRTEAMRRLTAAGTKVTPLLVKAARTAELESCSRAIAVLNSLALDEPPSAERGAWAALVDIAENSTGSRRMIATEAVGEIRESREEEAFERLTLAGITIKYDNFSEGARMPRPVYQIRVDENWNGDERVLSWIRWLRNIPYANLRNQGSCSAVLSEIVKIKGLQTIGLYSGQLDSKGIEALKTMRRIKTLELRYVKLTPNVRTSLTELPIRESLNMLGTGVSSEQADELVKSLPGLNIQFRRGGFLGVTCSTFGETECVISSVMPGSAADVAGLKRNDIVKDIDGTEIQKFADLQAVINHRVDGEKVELTFERFGKTEVVTVTLGRQAN